MIIDDKIIKDVKKKYFDTGIIKNNDTVMIALSGGSDSMCLLDVFYKLSDIYKINLIAIHVHHGIRGVEADEDQAFTERYCKSFAIPYIKKYVKAKLYADKYSYTIEEAARKLRYEALYEIWKKEYVKHKRSNVYIAIAHHMKDQVETIVHNMLRGTGLRGIAGMSDTRDYIIRPLLYTTKDEINDYIKKYDIPYVNDSTNDDESYTRNYIRNELLDKFLKVNDKAYEHIIDLSEQAREAIEYVETTSKYMLEKITKDVKNDSANKMIVIDLGYFRNMSNIIRAGVVREIFSRLVSTLKDVTKINIDDVIRLSLKNDGGHIDLPYNITLDKKKNDLIFSLNNKNVSMSRKKKGRR